MTGSPTDSARPRFGALRQSLTFSTLEGIVAELEVACAGGGVLTAWALHLGCSPLVVAMLGALPFLAQLIHLPAAWLTRLRGSRSVAIVAVAASRQAVLPAAALPFLPVTVRVKRAILIGVATLFAVLGAVGNNAWTSWMGELVPAPLRGRYFGKRTSIALLAGAIGALVGGWAIDAAHSAGGKERVLAGLSALGALGGVISTALMAQQDAPAPLEQELPKAGSMLKPLRDRRARPLLAYQVAWNAAIGISASFFAVYMLDSLRLGFTLVAAHGAAVALVRVLASSAWGRAVDRVGARPVLVFCSFGLFILPLLWLAPSSTHLLWPLVIDVILSGLFWGGHGLAAFELPMALASSEERPFYLATFATAAGVAFAVASIAGGWLAMVLPHRLWLFGMPFASLQLLFLLSAIGRLLAAPLALRVHEDDAEPVMALLMLVREKVCGWFAGVAE